MMLESVTSARALRFRDQLGSEYLPTAVLLADPAHRAALC